MTTPALSRRIARLETELAAMSPARTVQRHIIAAENDAARQARIRAIFDASSGNVLHIFRVIVSPGERGAA